MHYNTNFGDIYPVLHRDAILTVISLVCDCRFVSLAAINKKIVFRFLWVEAHMQHLCTAEIKYKEAFPISNLFSLFLATTHL